MHTTSRLALDVVDSTDAVSDYPTADAQAKGVLDAAVTFTEGTISARPAAALAGQLYYATDTGAYYVSNGSTWTVGPRPSDRGATNIATSQSTSSTSFATLATPDQVTGIVLPINGLIAVWYRAIWSSTGSGAGSATIFLGANQVESDQGGTGPVAQAALTAAAGVSNGLSTSGVGLISPNSGSSYGSDVTTGQIVSTSGGVGGGPCYLFAAAGTYTVSVRFKASAGSVTASSRKLWVQAIPFA